MIPDQARDSGPDGLISRQYFLESWPPKTEVLVLRQSIRQNALVEAANRQQMSVSQHRQCNSKNRQHPAKCGPRWPRQRNAGRRARRVIIRGAEQLLVSAGPARLLPVQRISLRGAQTPGDPKQTFVVQGRTQVLQKMQGRSCVRREELTRVVRQELGTQVLGHFSRKLRPISWSQQRSRRCNYRRSRDATSRCSRKVDETSGIGHRRGNRQRVIRNTEQGPDERSLVRALLSSEGKRSKSGEAAVSAACKVAGAPNSARSEVR